MRQANREVPPGGRLLLAAGAAAAACAAALVALAALQAGRAEVQPAPGGEAAEAADPAAAQGAADGVAGTGGDRDASAAPRAQTPSEDAGADSGTGGGPDDGGAAQAAATSRGRAWAEGAVDGGERLAGLTDEQLDEMLDAVAWWMDEHGYGDASQAGALECPLDPVPVVGGDDPAVSERAWLRLSNSVVCLQLEWFDTTRRWSCYRLTSTVEGLNDEPRVVTGGAGEVELGDLNSLGALLGADEARALCEALLAAYGRGGTPGIAYVVPDEVERTAGGMELTVHYAQADGAMAAPTVETRAAWDASAQAWTLEEVSLEG